MENRIKEILSQKGITAAELANSANLSKVSIYNIINGKTDASANTLNAIASSLNVPFWELFVNPRDVYNKELTALIQYENDFYSASTIEELQAAVDTIKEKIRVRSSRE